MSAPAVRPRLRAADTTTSTTPSCSARHSALARARPVILFVVVLVTGVVVESVLVVVLGIRVVVVGALRFRSDAQLLPQPVKVRAAAVVLELASNLNLLGLSSAAPHWLDPLERQEPCGPTMPLSLTCLWHIGDTHRTAVDPPRGPRRWPASVQVLPYPVCGPDDYADWLILCAHASRSPRKGHALPPP